MEFFGKETVYLTRKKRKSREGCCFLCSGSMGQVWRIEIINPARFLVGEGATTSTPSPQKRNLPKGKFLSYKF